MLDPILFENPQFVIRMPYLWKPMKDAPKNVAGVQGHRSDLDIDLWHIEQGRLTDCFWYAEFHAWFARSGGQAYNMGGDENFTHWMAKPEDPNPFMDDANVLTISASDILRHHPIYKAIQETEAFLHDLMDDLPYREKAGRLHSDLHEVAHQFVTLPQIQG